MTALLCLTTCPDFDTAQRIANALVEERLAACVNFVPGMHSTYRWQGKVEHAGEVLLLVKTTRVRMPAVQERIVALHPYELPGSADGRSRRPARVPAMDRARNRPFRSRLTTPTS